MTTVTFLTEDARIIGFDVQGHSGWGESGEDIGCAAITSAGRRVEATVNDVMGLCAAVKVREADASISLRLPGGLANTAESTCQNLLTGLMVYLAQQASGMHFSDDIVNVPGTSVMGEQRHAEYKVDSEALLELILSNFYEPVEG